MKTNDDDTQGGSVATVAERMDAGDADGVSDVGFRLLETVVCGNVGSCLQLCGWRAAGVLACVSGRVNAALEANEEAAWRASCVAIASERALYLPEGPVNGSWRRTFHELHDAREKWAAAVDLNQPPPQPPVADPVTGELLEVPEGSRVPGHAEPKVQHFNITVASRFRPGRPDGSKLVLPLHQRLKMLRKGEKLMGAAAEREGVDRAAVLESLVEMDPGGEMDPEVLAAVLEAEQLRRAAEQAAAEAVEHDAVWADEDDSSSGGGGVSSGERDGGDETAGALGAASFSARQAEARAAAEAKRRVEEDVKGSNGCSVDGRLGPSPKVLAVTPTRAVMFVPGAGVRPFHFARVFPPEATQCAVYADAARSSVLAALNGYNACVMCYGQTGSGKTHTLTGPPGALDEMDVEAARVGTLPPTAGVVPRALAQVLSSAPPGGVDLRVTAQYVQIYREKVTCLVSGADVVLRCCGGGSDDTNEERDHVSLVGAAETTLGDIGEAMVFLRAGEARRAVATTAANDRSSRAHTALVLRLEQRRLRDGLLVRSRLTLVDLAGSEQLKVSKASGDRRAEAIGINASLSVLGKCIAALAAGKRHVPYLESKLTTLLRPALGGNSRTTVIVTGSTEDERAAQTLAALRFGESCALVTNATRACVGSVSQALAAVDAALRQCERDMAGLELRGRAHLPGYAKMRERHARLARRRRELGRGAINEDP